jgi:hypothetical protein
VTRKPSGPIGRKKMEKGAVRSHKSDGEGPQAQVIRKPSGPTGRMEKGPTGTHRMEKGSSGDFYDELKASRMSNYRSHRYTSDGEGSHRYRKD